MITRRDRNCWSMPRYSSAVASRGICGVAMILERLLRDLWQLRPLYAHRLDPAGKPSRLLRSVIRRRDHRLGYIQRVAKRLPTSRRPPAVERRTVGISTASRLRGGDAAAGRPEGATRHARAQALLECQGPLHRRHHHVPTCLAIAAVGRCPLNMAMPRRRPSSAIAQPADDRRGEIGLDAMGDGVPCPSVREQRGQAERQLRIADRDPSAADAGWSRRAFDRHASRSRWRARPSWPSGGGRRWR